MNGTLKASCRLFLRSYITSNLLDELGNLLLTLVESCICELVRRNLSHQCSWKENSGEEFGKGIWFRCQTCFIDHWRSPYLHCNGQHALPGINLFLSFTYISRSVFFPSLLTMKISGRKFDFEVTITSLLVNKHPQYSLKTCEGKICVFQGYYKYIFWKCHNVIFHWDI